MMGFYFLVLFFQMSFFLTPNLIPNIFLFDFGKYVCAWNC